MAAKLTGLATLSCQIGGVNYLATCDSFTLDPDNTLEDGSGVAERWEDDELTKSRWTGSGDFKVLATNGTGSGDDLVAAAVSEDISGAFALNTGRRTFTGNTNVQRATLAIRNRALQMVSISLKGQGALVAGAVSI